MREKSLLHMFQGTFPQLIAVLTGTIGAISDGMHYGWTAPVLPTLESNSSHIHLQERDHIWLETIYMIGGITGLPITIFAVDTIGRKGSIIISAFMALVSWILIAVADSTLFLYIARYIIGLSGDVAFVAAPMYVAEIADKKIRGFLAGIIYLMMLLGILIIYAVAPYAPFYVPSIVGSVIVIIQLITFPFMPDSPYYLISKGKDEKAKRHLQRLRGSDDVDKELKEITAAVNRQKSEKGRPQDLVLIASNRKAVIIMVILNAAQHFSSISVMLMNLHEILMSADSIYMRSQNAGILFAALMLLSATIADFVVDKFGRKYLLTISSLLTGLCLLVLAVYFTFKNCNYDISGVSWIPIVTVMVYAAVFKFGLGIIPIVMTAELFPAKTKAMGMTIADCAYVFFAWISIEIYQRLSTAYGHEVPFYIFAASCILTAVFAQLYIPETKGKTLEEIQFILKGVPFPLRSNSLRSESLSFHATLDNKDNKINSTPEKNSNEKSGV
ncbi:facilitated trehalose transporter Tret1-like [Diorhabda carinulata]|uniref:facilitated trehalose transporter Tret1-like n=1 Tax=Diorhabda carinulata TaxID=1163345 RepID=UPI0025A20EE4|nr:facilitated trehalose transporter Tret1-like [Diorhabda carinulata]XP_057656039.1 facilitated trehalose transporter Tret1-like [Diorhabda carinulata]